MRRAVPQSRSNFSILLYSMPETVHRIRTNPANQCEVASASCRTRYLESPRRTVKSESVAADPVQSAVLVYRPRNGLAKMAHPHGTLPLAPLLRAYAEAGPPALGQLGDRPALGTRVRAVLTAQQT